MKTLMSLLAGLAMLTGTVAFAEETVPEKAKATTNDVKRQARKTGNRVDESVCTGTKAECAAGKVKHRANEGKENTKEKTDEMKNKVD